MPKENTKKERKERGLTEKKHRSVILFGEWQRPLGALSLEQKGMLLDALLAYPEGKRPDFTDPMLRMAWTFMEGGLDENARKWEETRQRRAEAGTKGAESRWHSEERGKNSKCHAPMAKMAVSGSDSVSDTGSASDSESEPDIVLPDGEADCADAPLPPPDEPDFCPPDEGEVRDYFIRKNGTEAQADRFRAFYESNGWRVGQNPMRNWQAAATVWMARDRERPAPAETYVPKNKAFYATRPPEQAKDFLKDAALRRQAMRKRREAVTQ